MKRIVIILSISSILILIACNGQSEKKAEHQETHEKETVAAKTYYYTCPMEAHKHIASSAPGDCSECGMKLVASTEVQADSADYFGCPMSQHSHIRHEKAGKCEECSMALKPMKLSSN
jgi:hypothetical protein